MEQLDVAVGHTLEVIDAEGTVGDRHRYSTRIGEFLTVNFSAKAVFQTSFQDSVGFFGREKALVAKHIDEIGQALASDFGQHLIDNQIDVFGLPSGIFATDGVRPKKRCHDLQRCRLLDAPNDAQHFQFVSGVQAVAALDFDGSRAFSDDFADAPHCLFVEFVFGKFVESVGRIEDSTTPTRNFGVTQTANLIDKLALATACIDNVRVAVAERRKHVSALSIDHFTLYRRYRIHLSKRLYSSVIDEHPSVVNRLQLGHFTTSQKQFFIVAHTDEFPDIFNQHFLSN